MTDEQHAPGWAVYTCAPIRLASDAAADESNKPRWIQIAADGKYLGHPTGPFNLDEVAFKEIVRNFRASKAYKADADGVGCERVRAFDFHHASEQEPAKVAVLGAPAQAWAYELEVRKGDGGQAQLWALTELLEPMRSYITQGKYQWTSVAIWPDAIDPVTGKNVGWYLSSIAFTNDPFIDGMIPIAAARGCCPDMLRARLTAQVACANMPSGVSASGEPVPRASGATPPDDLTDDERAEAEKLLAKCIELKVPYPWDDCIADQKKAGKSEESAAKICAYIKNKNAGGAHDVAPIAGQEGAVAPVLSAQVRSTMEKPMEEIIKMLCERFGVSEPAQLKARILAAADAAQGVTNLLEVLGVKTLEEAVDKAKAMLDILPQLEALAKLLGGEEQTAAPAEVDQAMIASKAPASMKPALMLYRTGGVELTEANLLAELPKRLAARDNFRKTYLTEPLAPAPIEPVPTYLTQTIATTPSGGVALLAGNRAPSTVEPPLGEVQKVVSDLQSMPGRNITEKAMALVRAQPGGGALSFEDTHEKACVLVALARRAS